MGDHNGCKTGSKKGGCREVNNPISSYHDCAPGDHHSVWNVLIWWGSRWGEYREWKDVNCRKLLDAEPFPGGVYSAFKE